MRAADIHAALGGSWRDVLVSIGIPEQSLRNKHGPCPACGGKDRFRFDNKRGRGDYICGQCGAGDGFRLVQMVLGVDFSEARRRVMDAAGLSGDAAARRTATAAPVRDADVPQLAKPPRRVYQLCSTTCAPEDQSDAVFYLDSRKLWPLPDGCTWRAHASVDYFEDADEPGGRKRLVGRYPALVAGILDRAGDLVTAHVTYLHEGRKLVEHEPRKIFSKLTGREGCAARLMPASETLGIAEGIETALSAHRLHGLPVWAAMNKSLLGKFEPPDGVRELVIFADRDEAGLDAACRLMERLQGRVRCVHRPPPAPHKDWNNVLTAGSHR